MREQWQQEIDADEEMDATMLDSTLSDLCHEKVGWQGVRVLQKLRSRMRSLQAYVSEKVVNNILEGIVRHDLSEDELIAFWQSPTRDERLGYLIAAVDEEPLQTMAATLEAHRRGDQRDPRDATAGVPRCRGQRHVQHGRDGAGRAHSRTR